MLHPSLFINQPASVDIEVTENAVYASALAQTLNTLFTGFLGRYCFMNDHPHLSLVVWHYPQMDVAGNFLKPAVGYPICNRGIVEPFILGQ